MRLIDADALKTVFEEKSSEAVCGVELCKAIISRIDEAQTVDAEPVRHAKWVHLGGDEWCCSACGEIEHTEGSWEHPLKDREWKYCRTCGAKMYETQKKPCDDCQEFDCYGCEYSEREEE
jgi:ribosomal protein L37E